MSQMLTASTTASSLRFVHDQVHASLLALLMQALEISRWQIKYAASTEYRLHDERCKLTDRLSCAASVQFKIPLLVNSRLTIDEVPSESHLCLPVVRSIRLAERRA